MALHKFKTIAAVSAMVLGIALMPLMTNAAPTTIGVSLSTSSAITTSSPRDLDFLTWLIIQRSTDTVAITMNHLGVLSTAGITTSTVQQLVAGTGTTGKLSVDLPDGSSGVVLHMSRTAATASMGAGLTLSAVTYSTAGEGNNNAFTSVTPVDVTVASGATPEEITFGGTISATATPADGAHTSSFDVSFAY